MDYFIAWWNVENLFDTFDADRPDWLTRKLKGELDDWDDAVLQKKLDQLSIVIRAMNDNKGPDLLGVCEVESAAVLQKLVDNLNLPDRQYAIVHSDTEDARGIDVAFIYDRQMFQQPVPSEVFNHVVLKRNATRDIVQVNFKTNTNPSRDLVVIGNHWPSRKGGEFSSEPYRIIAAETLSYWVERTSEIFEHAAGIEVPILVMGDFNDEPYNRSMTQYALAMKDSKRVKSRRSRKPYLFNLMWPMQEDGIGTHYFESWGMLDQVLVNRSLINNSNHCKLIPGSCGIQVKKEMLKRGKPRRFGRPANAFDVAGFSDHLPVYVKIKIS